MLVGVDVVVVVVTGVKRSKLLVCLIRTVLSYWARSLTKTMFFAKTEGSTLLKHTQRIKV